MAHQGTSNHPHSPQLAYSPQHPHSSAAWPIVNEIRLSRSPSPQRFNISDFEQGVRARNEAYGTPSKDVSYAGSQMAIDDLDFAAHSRSETPLSKIEGKGFKSSLFRTTSKLMLRASAAAGNLPHANSSPPPCRTPAHSSGAASPTKSLASLISNTPSSASKASSKARIASKVLFDSYFTGESVPVQLGVIQSPSREHPGLAIQDQQPGPQPERHASDFVCEEPLLAHEEIDMTPLRPRSTRSSMRLRPKQRDTADSNTSGYAATLGRWFSSGNRRSSLPASTPIRLSIAREEHEDPILNLNVSQALFPHGPADPLDPSSFNDLLYSAETLVSAYQSAYRQRIADVAQLRAELELRDDELEERETRAQHLKMQLQDLGEQCTAQAQKASTLEMMIREQCRTPSSGSATGPFMSGALQRHSRNSYSDSGFESDGDSVGAMERPKLMKAGQASVAVPMPVYNAAQNRFSNPADLRTENEMLRVRIAELEGAVEGCLDMITAPSTFGPLVR